MPRKTAVKKTPHFVPETQKPEQLILTAIPAEEARPAMREPLSGDEDDDVIISEEKFTDESVTGPGGKEKYFQAVGRRKESIARIRLYTKKSGDQTKDDSVLITVNGKKYREYFSDTTLATRLEAPLRKLKSLNRFKATVIVRGGGLSGQADAVRLGLARALEQFDINFRKKLKKSGYLTRDPRIKERRKYGLKKARKAPQWSKR